MGHLYKLWAPKILNLLFHDVINGFCKVVRNLTDAGAKVIAFDIQFDSEDFSSMIFEKNSYSECNDCDKY